MKLLLGFGLIILGIITFFRYLSNYGMSSFAELIGALIGIGLCTFLPGILLIRSVTNNITK
jgi:hypothetical protein